MAQRLSLSRERLVEGILKGEKQFVSKAITLVESTNRQDRLLAANVLDEVMPQTGQAIRLGITGAPGVGKSTFINHFGTLILQSFKKVAVLAVDPSSPTSKGSILGDKTRMDDLVTNSNVFIRPSPAGQALGGVGWKTREAILICEAAGYDFIIVETVGVGQSEVAVKQMVDFMLLLINPTGGDELQGMKKGIVELADALAITKADGESLELALSIKKEYESALQILHSTQGMLTKVFSCSAIEGAGLPDILKYITQTTSNNRESGKLKRMRDDQLVKWMKEGLSHELISTYFDNPKNIKLIDQLENKIRKREISPYSAILEALGSK